MTKHDHKYSHTSEGEGLEGYIIPVCSCGWTGRKEPNYSNIQFHRLRESHDFHIETLPQRRSLMCDDDKETLLQALQGAANFLRGMSFDPRIPDDIPSACISKATELDRIVEQHLD